MERVDEGLVGGSTEGRAGARAQLTADYDTDPDQGRSAVLAFQSMPQGQVRDLGLVHVLQRDETLGQRIHF